MSIIEPQTRHATTETPPIDGEYGGGNSSGPIGGTLTTHPPPPTRKSVK